MRLTGIYIIILPRLNHYLDHSQFQNAVKTLEKNLILTDTEIHGANFGHDAHDVHTTTVDAAVWGRS